MIIRKKFQAKTSFSYLFFIALFLLLTLSCSSDNDEIIEPEEVQLKEIQSELVSFTFIPDTGNNTSRLSYEFKFTNPNNQDIVGFPQVSYNLDGQVVSRIATSSTPCYNISANSTCTLRENFETSLNLGRVESATFISISYRIVE